MKKILCLLAFSLAMLWGVQVKAQEPEIAPWVDMGKDWNPKDETIINAASGVFFAQGVKEYTVNAETENEVKFTVGGAATAQKAANKDVYKNGTSESFSYTQIGSNSKNGTWFEASASTKEIAEIKLNGTTGSTSVAVKGAILFSRESPFDGSSIVGYGEFDLPFCRAGDTAISITNVPIGTKSFRVYNPGNIVPSGAAYALDTVGDNLITVGDGKQSARLAYVSVKLKTIIQVEGISVAAIRGIPVGESTTLTASLTPAEVTPVIDSWELASAEDSLKASIEAVPGTLTAKLTALRHGKVNVKVTSGSVTSTLEVMIFAQARFNTNRNLFEFHFNENTWASATGNIHDPGTVSASKNVDGIIVLSGAHGNRVLYSGEGAPANSSTWLPKPTGRAMQIVARSANYVGDTDSAKIMTMGGVEVPNAVNAAQLKEVVAYFKGATAGAYVSFALEISDGDNVLALIRDETAIATANADEVLGRYIVPEWIRSRGGDVTLRLRGFVCNADGTLPSSAGGRNIWLHDIYVLGDDITTTDMTLKSNKQEVWLTDTTMLTAMLTPTNADPFLTWGFVDAADTALATIQSLGGFDGYKSILTAKMNIGTLEVVATAENGVSDTIELSIVPPEPLTMELKTPYTRIALADEVILAAAIEPNLQAVDKTITWEITGPAAVVDSSHISPDSLRIKFPQVGEYRVIGTTFNNLKDTLDIKVETTILVDSIKLAGYSVTYGRAQITPTIYPGNASQPVLQWTSSNEAIATVDGTGLVSVVGEGNITIKAAATDVSGKYAEHALRTAFVMVDSLNGDAASAAAGKTMWVSDASTTAIGVAQWNATQYPLNRYLLLNQVSSSGNCRAMATFDNPVFFDDKLAVEFDWWIMNPYSTSDSNEGQVSLRDVDNKDIVTLYLQGRSRSSYKGIYVAVGQIPMDTITPELDDKKKWDTRASHGVSSEYFTYVRGEGDTLRQLQGVLPEYRDITTFAEYQIAPKPNEEVSNLPYPGTGGTYFHVKIEVYTTQKMVRVQFTNEAGVSQHIELPAPADFNPSSFANVFINMIRRGSNIMPWQVRFDNFRVKNAVNEKIAPTKVVIEAENPAINLGDSVLVTAKFEPYDVDNKQVTWSFADPANADFADIVTMENGTNKYNTAYIRSKGDEGFVKVVATSAMNGAADTIELRCYEVMMDSLKLSGVDTLAQLRTAAITPIFYPSNTYNKELEWASSDPTIATVDVNGVVTAVAEGLVTITATSIDGTNKVATKVIEVIFKPVQTIALNGARRLFFGQAATSWASFNIYPTAFPADASEAAAENLTWSSENEAVATVNNGLVTIAGAGKTAIKVSAAMAGVDAYYYIEVAEESLYDGYTDFEDGTSGLFRDIVPSTGGLDGTLGASNTPESGYLMTPLQTLDSSMVMRVKTANNAGGGRLGIMTLKDSIKANLIEMSFDWYPLMDASLVNLAALSVRADSSSETGIHHDIAAPGKTIDNNILTLSYKRVTADSAYIGYHTSNYTMTKGSLSGWPEGTPLKFKTLNMWYTVNITYSGLTNTMSFTISERDNRNVAQTVEGISLDGIQPKNMGKVKSFLAIGYRSGGLNMTQALDNFVYNTFDVTTTNVSLNPNGGQFSDGSDTVKVIEVMQGQSFSSLIPAEPTREHYSFLGWKVGATEEFYTSTFTTDEPATLTAAWQIDSFTVRFRHNAADYDVQKVAYGAKLVKPTPDPVSSIPGQVFASWLRGAVAWNFDTDTVTTNFQLLANFENATAVADLLLPLSIFPNPAVDEVKVANAELTAGDKIMIYSMSGVLVTVYEVSGGEYTTCNIAQLPQGSYIVKVANKVAKLIKK